LDEQGKKTKCPVTVLWEKKGRVGTMFDALKERKAVSEGEVEGAKHWIAGIISRKRSRGGHQACQRIFV
jgi:hypothetical protein